MLYCLLNPNPEYARIGFLDGDSPLNFLFPVFQSTKVFYDRMKIKMKVGGGADRLFKYAYSYKIWFIKSFKVDDVIIKQPDELFLDSIEEKADNDLVQEFSEYEDDSSDNEGKLDTGKTCRRIREWILNIQF